ncbi:MAG: sulfatase [bacterium]|nr:sulfatase [bacterium]
MKRSYRIRIGILAGVFLLAGVLWLWYSSLPRSGTSPNVIIISVDTMRADHLGLYGYSRDTSPNLDAFASEALVFDQAIAQAPFTLPSVASIFTSQYPSANGLLDTSYRLAPSKLTIAETLSQYGYQTAAFVGDGELQGSFGINQGFDRYIDQGGVSLKETIPLALRWLERDRTGKFFLFLQGFDVHAPYWKPGPYNALFADPEYRGILADSARYWLDYALTSKNPRAVLDNIKKLNGAPVLVEDNGTRIPLTQEDIEYIVASYDGGVRYTDNLIAGFFDELKQLGLFDNSIIIVLAGHGESLGDILKRSHPSTDGLNVIGHGQVYDELVRAPLLMKVPGFESSRVSSQVQLIDLFPTILDFLKIPQSRQVRANIQGESLLPLLKGEQEENPDSYAFGEGEGGALRFVRTPFWKLIVRGENMFELYHLQEDSGETTSMYLGQSDVVGQLQDVLANQYLENLQIKSRNP